MSIRHPGMCKICGAPTHEISHQFPIGHTLVGRPRRVGKPLSGVVKAHMLLSDGTWADLSLHRDCYDNVGAEALVRLWADVLETFRFEDDHRKLLGAQPLNRKQRAVMDRYLAKLGSVVPLGLIACSELRR